MSSEQPLPTGPQVRFPDPASLVVYLEFDNCMKACVSAAQHAMFVNQPVHAAGFAQEAKTWEHRRDEFLRQLNGGIIIAPAGSVPPPKIIP